jgi:hypothetical protein
MNLASSPLNQTLLADYPSPQREIAQALKGAFGAVPIESIKRIVGGATTALTLRVQAGGRSYLLRVEGEPSPLRNPYQHQSMRIAAEAGIAPGSITWMSRKHPIGAAG